MKFRVIFQPVSEQQAAEITARLNRARAAAIRELQLGQVAEPLLYTGRQAEKQDEGEKAS